jgi:putative ABC transport system permease protein
VPVLSGRTFTEGDAPGTTQVIVINEALAHRYFVGEAPVGRQLDRGTIVGVVGDVRQIGLGKPAVPEIYYPAAQVVTMSSDIGMSLIVRSSARPESLVNLVRATVREVNPKLAIFNIRTMKQIVADSLWELNLYRWLIGLFAALALLLVAIGLYGVISYNVVSRLRELALRLALGSDPWRLVGLVVGRAVRLTGLGLTTGIVAAFAIVRVLSRLRVDISSDLVSFASISALLLVIALVACVVPAIRAAAVNPATALRNE